MPTELISSNTILESYCKGEKKSCTGFHKLNLVDPLRVNPRPKPLCEIPLQNHSSPKSAEEDTFAISEIIKDDDIPLEPAYPGLPVTKGHIRAIVPGICR